MIFLVIILLTAIYVLFVLPTQWLKVERVRHAMGLDKKILQISDLHVDKIRISPNRLKKVIDQEKPDYICLTGDFIQQEKYLQYLYVYLEMLVGSGVPVFAVLGNHDHQPEDVEKLAEMMKFFGIRLLRNESLLLPAFQLIGIDDHCSGKSNVDKAYQDVIAGKPVIVMTHDPNLVLKLQRGYDYLMAGHFHGKQINLPFLFKLRPMGDLPARGIYKGLHKGKWGTCYISKGVGQSGINARLFVRCEVTIHYI